MSTRSTTAILAATAAALTMTVTLGGSAGAVTAVTRHDVRQSDFSPQGTATPAGYGDTRASGQYGFGPNGLVVETKDNSSTAKVAEYFTPATSAFPASGSYVWDGTTNQPGSQIVFSVPGYGYNVLVGEQVYSTNGAGQPLTDWWMTGGSTRAVARGISCPVIGSGSGSDCHGSLEQWKANLPASTTVPAIGLSLGSGIQGSGVLTSLTFGNDEYDFTAGARTSSGTVTTGTTTTGGTQVAAPVAVTGTATHRSYGRNTRVTLTSDALPAGATEAAKLQWQIFTGPRGGTLHRRLVDTMGAGETLGWGFTFPAHQSRREVRILRNGVVVADYTVK